MDPSDATPSAELGFDVFAARCTSRATMETITSRWGALTLAALADTPMRFGELRRRIGGVSEKMLSQTLKQLEAGGLLTRTVVSETPLAVEYALTDAGQQVAAAIMALIDTVYRVQPAVDEARSA